MNLYDFTVLNTKQEEVLLSEYKNKVILIVNTAPKCGLASQYAALETLYKKYQDKGLVILDFPCNQFLKQANGSNEEINNVCTLNHGTTYPRFAKVNVNGKNSAPLYKWLRSIQPKDIVDGSSITFDKMVRIIKPFASKSDIRWNFTKFLIDNNGQPVARFSPTYSIDKIEAAIIELLD